MMEDMVSLFIDDEMTLDEKIVFVEKVHGDARFKHEAVRLLEQERLIRSDAVDRIPEVLPARRWGWFRIPLWQPLAFAASAAVVVLIFLYSMWPSGGPTQSPYRFVVFRPDVKEMEITGTFSEWKGLPMRRIGDTGYWEIVLEIPKGEHRFVYILDGGERLADPTIPRREPDDFGGENSILSVSS